MLSNVLFIIGAIYLVAFFVEIPIFYMGNPKTRFFIEKMGKKNYKLLLLGLGAAFLIAGYLLR